MALNHPVLGHFSLILPHFTPKSAKMIDFLQLISLP